MTRIHTLFGVVVAMGLALAQVGCSKTTPEPEKTETPSTPKSQSSSAAATAKPSESGAGKAAAANGDYDLAWDAPSAWTSMPNPNTMRKATYKVPKASGDSEDAELTVSAASGGVDANIKRWAGQFGNAEPKTEPRSVNGLKVTLVEIKGPYASGGGMMGGPTTQKDKFMLLGAVVDAGERQHFFKMTGPEKTVTQARRDFDALVSSFRAK